MSPEQESVIRFIKSSGNRGFFMETEEKQTNRFANIFIGLLVFVVIVFFGYGFLITRSQTNQPIANNPTPTIAFVDYISYVGITGKTALDLLDARAAVVQAASGLVVSINGRKADNGQHEYWAFYINGKVAQVGPKDYITKDGDKIEWKIEKY